MTEKTFSTMEGPVCPLPLSHHDTIVMGHGSGGRMTQDLIRQIFQPYLSAPELLAGNDFAEITLSEWQRQTQTGHIHRFAYCLPAGLSRR